MAGKKAQSAMTDTITEATVAPKTTKRKTAKPITEPEPKSMEEIAEMTEQIMEEVQTPAEVPASEEPLMTAEEKEQIIEDINKNTEEIDKVMATDVEEGLKLVEKQISHVAEISKKINKEVKKQNMGKAIYSWNGILYE